MKVEDEEENLTGQRVADPKRAVCGQKRKECPCPNVGRTCVGRWKKHKGGTYVYMVGRGGGAARQGCGEATHRLQRPRQRKCRRENRRGRWQVAASRSQVGLVVRSAGSRVKWCAHLLLLPVIFPCPVKCLVWRTRAARRRNRRELAEVQECFSLLQHPGMQCRLLK